MAWIRKRGTLLSHLSLAVFISPVPPLVRTWCLSLCVVFLFLFCLSRFRLGFPFLPLCPRCVPTSQGTVPALPDGDRAVCVCVCPAACVCIGLYDAAANTGQFAYIYCMWSVTCSAGGSRDKTPSTVLEITGNMSC